MVHEVRSHVCMAYPYVHGGPHSNQPSGVEMVGPASMCTSEFAAAVKRNSQKINDPSRRACHRIQYRVGATSLRHLL